MDWHDKTCTRPDVVAFGEGLSCLSCGSIRDSDSDPVRPPISQDSQIRLLRILPGNFDEPVKCEIAAESLSSHPEYDAISYTWADDDGDASECCSVLVAGRPIPVTRNCEMALRRVRMRFSTRRVWIDSVCIDQGNVAERGHQVGLMPKIYSGARAVVMYVGEATPDSADLMVRLENGGSLMACNWLDITSRRYFNRLWILQEVALARKATLVCGPNSLHWGKLRREFGRLAPSRFLPPVFHFDHHIFSSPHKLLDLLIFSQSCQASDPRDKVFGLLGLLPSGKIGDLGADYSMTVEGLYTRVALHLVSYMGWRHVLSLAGLNRRPGSVLESLPSWVPDWSVPSDRDKVRTSEKLLTTGIKTLNYDESSRCLRLMLLRIPGLKMWNEWGEHVAALRHDYLFFPNTHLMPKPILNLAMKKYLSFYEYSEHGNSWDGPSLPCGLLSTSTVDLTVQKRESGRWSLLEFGNDERSKYSLTCLSIEAAVQVFTLTSLLPEPDGWREVLRCVNNNWPWTETHDRRLFTEDMSFLLGAADLAKDDSAEVLRRLPQHLKPPNEEYGGDFDEALGGLWMRKFLANELKSLRRLDPSGDDLSTEASWSSVIEMNDILWRLLVRCFSMAEVTLEIV